MRNIIFRGKRIDNGEWEYGSLVRIRPNCSDEQVYITDKMTGALISVVENTVTEFAGFVDCLG